MAILICDDHPLVRGALAMAAEAACGEDEALTARDFTEGWAIAERTPGISLCIVDLHMPGAGPLEGLKGLIARDLGLSPATVKTHVAQVIAVLGAANRTEASAKARASGLL